MPTLSSHIMCPSCHAMSSPLSRTTTTTLLWHSTLHSTCVRMQRRERERGVEAAKQTQYRDRSKSTAVRRWHHIEQSAGVYTDSNQPLLLLLYDTDLSLALLSFVQQYAFCCCRLFAPRGNILLLIPEMMTKAAALAGKRVSSNRHSPR